MSNDLTKIAAISPHSSPVLVTVGDIDIIVDQSQSPAKAWLNSCPHTGAPLATEPTTLVNQSGEFECCLHGATFARDTGLCTSGPCVNKYLDTVPLTAINGELWAKLPN